MILFQLYIVLALSMTMISFAHLHSEIKHGAHKEIVERASAMPALKAGLLFITLSLACFLGLIWPFTLFGWTKRYG